MSLPASPPGYTLQAELGEGGFGKVYKAIGPNGVSALKAINLSSLPQSAQSRAIKQWDKEVSALVNASHHTNVVQYHRSFYHLHTLWLDMEFCSGGSLQTYFHKHGLSQAFKRQIMKEIANAVDYLHGIQIIHRDLKPDNVLIQHNNSGHPYAKLADFGLAYSIANVSLSGDLSQYYMSSKKGTLYYLAPEVYESHYTFKADIYAMGVIFMAIVRETTVNAGDPQGYLTSFVKDTTGKRWPLGEYAKISKKDVAVNPDAIVGPNLRQLVGSMLLFDHHKRPTANEVYVDLKRLQDVEFDPSPKSRPIAVNPPPYQYN